MLVWKMQSTVSLATGILVSSGVAAKVGLRPLYLQYEADSRVTRGGLIVAQVSHPQSLITTYSPLQSSNMPSLLHPRAASGGFACVGKLRVCCGQSRCAIRALSNEGRLERLSYIAGLWSQYDGCSYQRRPSARAVHIHDATPL